MFYKYPTKMAKISVVFRGRIRKDGTAPIELVIYHKRQNAYINLGINISPDQWNGCYDEWVKDKKAKAINQSIECRLAQAQADLSRMENIHLMSATEIKDALLHIEPKKESHKLTDELSLFMDIKTESTRKLYDRTRRAVEKFDGDVEIGDVTPDWLTRFENSLKSEGNKQNTIAIHLRNIRAVVKRAIDDEIIFKDPFRKFKVKTEPTDAQPMTLEQLKLVWHHPLEEWQEEWVAMFKLCFYLIGINMVDLSRLTKIEKDGYIRYKRAKTGRAYCIKVEPEALAIINQYRGEDHLLACFDRYVDYKQVNRHMMHAVKSIAAPVKDNPSMKSHGRNHGPKKRNIKASPLADVQQYSSRRTWATVAYNDCDISMDVISLCLGHSDGMGLSVTQRYVKPKQSKIDEANRKVIDYLISL